MALLQRISASFLLLLICSTIQALDFQNYTKNWSSKEGFEFFKGNDFDTPDNSFLYASCKSARDLGNFHCDITVDAPTEVKTCNTKFRISESTANVTRLDVMNMRRFNGNKIFISSMLSTSGKNIWFIRVSVLNLSDCSVTELVEYSINFSDNEVDSMIGPVIYNNTFDVFVSNNPLCGDSITCKISYDQTGKQIGKSTPFPVNLRMADATPIILDTHVKGFFVQGWKSLPFFEVKYVSPAGEVKNLITERVHPDDLYNSVISNAHEIYGICYRNEKVGFSCLQFDSNGKILTNITMKTEENEILRGVYNLAEGQMLVFIGQHQRNWTVRKITAQIQEKPLQLDFTCEAKMPWQYKIIVKEINDQFIFYLTCLENPHENKSVSKHMKYSVQYASKKSVLNMS